MEPMTQAIPLPTGDLVIERTFYAPLEEVWNAWTQPEMVKKWWGPREYTSPVAIIDFRVGGRTLNCMRGPDGKDIWSTGVYREIIPLKKVVVTDSFADEQGNVVPGSYYGMGDDFPLELLLTVTFTEDHGITHLKLIHSGMPLGEQMDGARDGWSTSLDKLENLLMEKSEVKMYKTNFIAEPGKSMVVITRMFDEPPDVVYKVLTDAGQIPYWWGPAEYETVVDHFHPEEGGFWRFVQTEKDGKRYGFHGVFHEATAPSRMVYTSEFEGVPGHATLIINTLENVEGMTKLTQKYLFESEEDRDGMIGMDMRRGVEETMDRLSMLLKECCPEVY